MDENSKERTAGGDIQREKRGRHWWRITESCLHFDFGFMDHLPRPQFTYCMWLCLFDFFFKSDFLLSLSFTTSVFLPYSHKLTHALLSHIYSPSHTFLPCHLSLWHFSPTPEHKTHLRPPLYCHARTSSQWGVLRVHISLSLCALYRERWRGGVQVYKGEVWRFAPGIWGSRRVTDLILTIASVHQPFHW